VRLETDVVLVDIRCCRCGTADNLIAYVAHEGTPQQVLLALCRDCDEKES